LALRADADFELIVVDDASTDDDELSRDADRPARVDDHRRDKPARAARAISGLRRARPVVAF
jgi:glycosyltransferase involved in cell wall biosynthesis